MVQCPRCGTQATELKNVDSDMMQKLQEAGENPPAQVCSVCHSDLRKTLALTSGGVLLMQEKAKEMHRLQLWKSRVNLIKKARGLMAQKMYSEAAACYEKYIRILEIVFDCKKGESLTPDRFKESARTSELTIVTSVYWDLLRIYDSSDKFIERLNIAAKQLALFVQFTPIYPDIIKRAEAFVKNAKHPQVIKAFLKGSSQQRPRCFIATAAYESEFATEVQVLRWYRDYYLQKSFLGRAFIKNYYKFSPALARWIDQNPSTKPFVRSILRVILKFA